MTTRLVLEPPAPFINANSRLHWRREREQIKAWRELARELALDELNRGTAFQKVHVYAWFRFADNRRRDVANLYGTVKCAIDGCVEAGLLALGDHDEVFVGPDMRREYPNGSPRLTLEIRELK